MTVTAIFLPGLYGSTLQRNDALRWPNLAEILLRRRGLGMHRSEPLRAGHVVKRFVVVPGLYAVDVYGNALAGLRRQAGSRVEWRELAYDWRAEISTQMQQLDAAIDAERARGRHIALISHSLGGLLACYYLRYGVQAIDQARESWSGAAKIDFAALVGVPFGGSALALVDLIEGRRILGNGHILDAATYRSFGATWQLLPAGETPLIDTQGEPIPADLFDPDEWRRLGLIATADATASHLQHARNLRRLLAQAPTSAPPRRLPLLVVQGVNRPTLARVVWHAGARGQRLIDDPKRWRQIASEPVDSGLLLSDGDGVITRSASTAPVCWNEVMTQETVEVRRSHRYLLNDGIVQQRIASSLGAITA